MPRRRFLVALVPDDDLLERIRTLRRLLGGPERERVPPHVTVVPPLNVPAARVPELRDVLRRAAGTIDPFEVVLGPASTFAPRNPTLHLGVGGSGTWALGELRTALRVPPFDRVDEHPFVPHLTLLRRAPDALTGLAPELLPGELGPWQVDSVRLFEQVHDDTGTSWAPVTEEPLGGPVVVGRGGVELHLRTTRIVERLRGAGGDDVVHVVPPGDAPNLVVSAEPPGPPGDVIAHAVGRVDGGLARLDHLEVVEEERGVGVARQVLARWCTDAGRRGAAVVLAEPARHDTAAEVLGALGFSNLGRVLIRAIS